MRINRFDFHVGKNPILNADFEMDSIAGAKEKCFVKITELLEIIGYDGRVYISEWEEISPDKPEERFRVFCSMALENQ